MCIRIALIGDFNASVTAHNAIPLAIEIAASHLDIAVQANWIDTDAIQVSQLDEFNAIWCVPASPYKSMQGALSAIEFARENARPFLGTCGGFQHAALEFARNALGYTAADSAEENLDTEMPLISALVCALVEKTDSIALKASSFVATIYKASEIDEQYRCSFGVNPQYLSIYEHSAMQFTGKDKSGEPRILEIAEHPFFIGTAFQPERSALQAQSHPLITAFIQAAGDHYQQRKLRANKHQEKVR